MKEFHRSIRNLEVEKLISELNNKTDLKGTMLSICSSQSPDVKSQIDIIKILIKHGVNINEKDKNGVSPLHRAVRFRKPEIVKFLIANGADVNCVDKRSASTPLHRAVVNSGAPSTKGKNQEAKRIIEILLANGADPNLKNKKGNTPFDYVKKESFKKLFAKQIM